MTKPNIAEHDVDNELDLKIYGSQVHGRIGKDVSGDYILAVLDENQRIAVTEMVYTAHFVRKLMEHIRNKAKTWKYNNETQTWQQIEIPIKEQIQINHITERTFGS